MGRNWLLLTRTMVIAIVIAVIALMVTLLGCQAEDSASQPTAEVAGPPELRILQPKHFVPRYDIWFDAFAEKWGEANGVAITVDHVALGDLKSTADGEIARGSGHDLIELVSPPANLEPYVLDLTDLNLEAQRRFGEQIPLCTRTSYNPTTKKFYGFCHGWVPDPGDYRRSLWEIADMPQGPDTWEDLLDAGSRIKRELTIQLGIGMSPEIDSNMAGRTLLWSFGASVQDENENVVINSPEAVAAAEYLVRLYQEAMTDEVFGWDPASNNKALVAAKASFILNSVSAYRTAQKTVSEVSDDVFFVPPLLGPSGQRMASAHLFNVYVIPEYSPNAEIAQKFLLDFVAQYDRAVYNSELYNFPAFFSTAPDLMRDGGWLDQDPFHSNPPDKLSFLKEAPSWSTNVGYPGPANAAIGEVYDSYIIPEMFARAAREELTPAEAVAWAESQIVPIFDKWRDRGLVGSAD